MDTLGVDHSPLPRAPRVHGPTYVRVHTVADVRLYVNFKFLTGVHKPMAKAAGEYAAFSEYIERIGARESAIAIKPPARKK